MKTDQIWAYDKTLAKIAEWKKSSLKIPFATLDLSLLGLTTVPNEVWELAQVTTLDLSFNELESAPAELAQLTNLTTLNLGCNQLTSVSGELSRLKNLRVLQLHRNRIKSLPAQLGDLANLERLILANNKLDDLPRSLRRLKNLSELALHENKGLRMPTELLGPTWDYSGGKTPPANPQTILDFYFARESEGAEAMREVRLLLVGRGRVGKTSLLKVLRGNDPDAQECETPGITVLPLPLSCAQGTAKAHSWDFGGQEFLHGTHQIFLSKRCVYLLVLEGRESNWETETDYWLRFIQSFGGDSPVIVVLNKYAAHKFSVDRFRLQERCSQIVGFVETDALTGLGIDDLRKQLERTINEMPDVWLGVPKSWHRVKEEMARMPESFLDYTAYQALCIRQKVSDEQEQASLAETLHRLGIALNFRDHHRLKETSVLKPQWVTEGVYGLLRYAQARDCHGVLERAWLAEALPAEQYPSGKHAFVMELMEKFEVAVCVGREGGDDTNGAVADPGIAAREPAGGVFGFPRGRS
jgi:internalin A